MVHGFESGKAQLTELVASAANDDLNEADTRFRYINVLLNGVLGWPPEEISCEPHEDGDYFDYVLGADVRSVVVEAKRTATHFQFPTGPTQQSLTVKSFRDHAPENRNATEQVSGYCQKSGIGIAVLCNGHQLIAFLGSRTDGKSPFDGRLVSFASLDDMLNRFNELWDLLSPSGVESDELRRRLASKADGAPPPAPLSKRIHSYPGFRIGSAQEIDLAMLGNLFIQDLAREESITDEFLAECYCTSGALSQYATVSKEILRTRYAALKGVVGTQPSTNKHGLSTDLMQDLMAAAISRRPLILLGDVGVGKSIFLQHFLRIDVAEFKDSMVVFYVDFLKHSGLDNDVPAFLRTVISEALEKTLGVDIDDAGLVRAIYNGELNKFRKGIYGTLAESDPKEFSKHELNHLETLMADPYRHLRRTLEFLQATRQAEFVLVLDNLDQHSTAFQERIFVAGEAFAREWPCTVFMSLRPDTFHESRTRGVIAAYQPRVFTVSPPRADLVVLKRLVFARKQLEATGRLDGFPKNLTLSSESLIAYIDALILAFERNDKLIEMVDNLSSGNTRQALDLVSRFVGSGYVQVQRILDAADEGRNYVVPIHEFLRAILYGDHRYYDPSVSAIPNLFSIASRHGRDHFLTPILLATIESAGSQAEGGFATRNAVNTALAGFGFSPGSISYHLSTAISTRLVEAPPSGDYESYLRVKPAGSYMWKVLVSEFAYLDAILVDTPILDTSTRTRIQDVSDIYDRVLRCRDFIAYLDENWKFGEEPTPFPWPEIKAQIMEGLLKVEGGAARSHARRS